jgi:hypothetical protein
LEVTIAPFCEIKIKRKFGPCKHFYIKVYDTTKTHLKMNVYAKLTPHMNDFQNIESLNLPQKLTTVYYLAITMMR